SSAHIGHGGNGATGAGFGGEIAGTVGGELQLAGGTGFSSFAQIGHGGRFAVADMDGTIDLTVTGDITMAATDGDAAAYSKIGHGDDISGPYSVFAGTGNRSGDIRVATDGSLTMTD